MRGDGGEGWRGGDTSRPSVSHRLVTLLFLRLEFWKAARTQEVLEGGKNKLSPPPKEMHGVKV